MKSKSWIATASGLAIASLVLVSGPVLADPSYDTGRSSVAYDYARVLSVTPAIRYVTVSTPVKECWDDVEYYKVRDRRPGRFGKSLFGAIVGGVVGHQIGGGRGNEIATAAGAVIGAAIANDAGRDRQGHGTTEYSRPVRRCETNYQSRQEERIDGYDVIYTFNGQKYSTRTPFDPGDRLRIRVDVRPAV